MAKIIPATSAAIAYAAQRLRAGDLVAFPTETVYGLGAPALDSRAVARVFEAKGRPRFDPLIVHVAGLGAARGLVAEFPPAAEQLARKFWPGPLTIVLPKAAIVPDLVTAGRDTVAIRVPDHPVALELLRVADAPLAAPSANLFGRISPTTAEHVNEQLGDMIELILDGGPCRVGVESTVVQLTGGRARLLRPGGTPIEDVEAVLGLIESAADDDVSGPHGGLASPGRLPQHYAPRTPLVFREQITSENMTAPADRAGPPGDRTSRAPRLGLLALEAPADVNRFDLVEILSPSGDLREAATRFFAALRRLDSAGLDLIVALPFPDHGLGKALNDRLRRAAQSIGRPIQRR
ncbi:MAG: L-threonylcarbamoyladenylate synthase [Planctomycetaceae bacterium]